MPAKVILDPEHLREAAQALRDPYYLAPGGRHELADRLDVVARASDAGLEPIVSAGAGDPDPIAA